jgi:hypothetical protein
MQILEDTLNGFQEKFSIEFANSGNIGHGNNQTVPFDSAA